MPMTSNAQHPHDRFSPTPGAIRAALPFLSRLDAELQELGLEIAVRIAEAIFNMGTVSSGHVDVLLDVDSPHVPLIAQIPDRASRAVSALLSAGPFVFRFADFKARSYPAIATHGGPALEAIGNAPCAILLGESMTSWASSHVWYGPVARCIESGHSIGSSPSHPGSSALFDLILRRASMPGGAPRSHGDPAARQLRSIVRFLERDGECDDLRLVGTRTDQHRIYLIDGHHLDTRTLRVHAPVEEGGPTLSSILPLSGPLPPYLHPSLELSHRALFDRAMWVKSIFDWMHETVPATEVSRAPGY